MCAILDNDVVHLVFGQNRPAAGKAFFDWIDSGRGRLVGGGRLFKELARNENFRRWWQEATASGRVERVGDEAVEAETVRLAKRKACGSNDAHVIALALVSGARLLYSNDKDLGDDFRNDKLINPRGKVYTTRRGKDAPPEFDNKKFRPHHRELLERNACRPKNADA